MRRTSILVLATLGAFTVFGARPVGAQDILGLSLRPTDELPSGTARGSADIVSAAEGQYTVSVDLSAASDDLKLADFDGAQAFTMWAVDTHGVRHNLGTLDDTLTLKGAVAAFAIARLFVTAEADGATTAPEGKELFSATLRSVKETSATATPAATAAAKDATPAASAAPKATAAAATDAKPQKMPTTGGPVPDALVIAVIALALLVLGWRLRAVRI